MKRHKDEYEYEYEYGSSLFQYCQDSLHFKPLQICVERCKKWDAAKCPAVAKAYEDSGYYKQHRDSKAKTIHRRRLACPLKRRRATDAV